MTVKVYSGRGGYSTYTNVDKNHLRLIKKDIKKRNKRLKKAKYPQRYYYDVLN